MSRYYICDRSDVLKYSKSKFRQKNTGVNGQEIGHLGDCTIRWTRGSSCALIEWDNDSPTFPLASVEGPYTQSEILNYLEANKEDWSTDGVQTLRLATDGLNYGIECDPLNDIYYEFEIDDADYHFTLPVVVYGATKDEVFNQLFESWTVDDDGNLDTYTERTVTLSIDYTKEDGEQTAADAMEIISGLMTRPVKHPERDEWAMLVNTTILARAEEGAKKDALMGKHLDKVNAGKNKSKADAKADNWHKHKKA